MPHRALIRIIIATLVGLAIWVPASAASADDGCCSMTLSGLPATFQAGADPVVFSAAISVNEPADPQQAFRYLAAQFDLQAGNNLSGGQLHFAWRPQNSNGNWHSVGFSRHDGLLQATFYPYQNVPNAGQININLRLSFGDHVPATNLQVGMVLMGSARKSDAKELAHAGPFASAVLPEAATPPPTHTAAPPAAVVPSPTASPVETATATPEDTSTSGPGCAAGGRADEQRRLGIGRLDLLHHRRPAADRRDRSDRDAALEAQRRRHGVARSERSVAVR